MLAGRQSLGSLILVAAGLMGGGCEQIEPFRQGVHSTYKQELRQLAEETSRKALAKASEQADEESAAAEMARDEVAPANHWQSPSLLSAVHLQPPVPLDFGPPGPP